VTATVIRHASRRKFTQVDRRAVNRADLSFRALGVLVWLLDKPDGWRGFNAEAMADGAGREGRDAVRTALRELEAAGYVVRERVQGSGGQWVTETWIYEHPGDRTAGAAPEPENQSSVDSPASGVTGAWKTDSRSARPSPSPSTERDTARARDQRPRVDERRESPPVDMYHPDDDERDRVRANLAAFRADLGMSRSPHERNLDR